MLTATSPRFHNSMNWSEEELIIPSPFQSVPLCSSSLGETKISEMTTSGTESSAALLSNGKLTSDNSINDARMKALLEGVIGLPKSSELMNATSHCGSPVSAP